MKGLSLTYFDNYPHFYYSILSKFLHNIRVCVHFLLSENYVDLHNFLAKFYDEYFGRDRQFWYEDYSSGSHNSLLIAQNFSICLFALSSSSNDPLQIHNTKRCHHYTCDDTNNCSYIPNIFLI